MFCIVRVEGGDSIAESFARQVSINFGGGDVFVAEHFLYSTEVGTVFDQFGGDAVAE